MTKKEIAEIIQHELTDKNWGFTEQILEIHSPVYQNDNISIGNITESDKEIAAYIPIMNEPFYLTFYINLESKEITGISTEPNVSVYFKATSDKINSTELEQMIQLQTTESWNKGEQKQIKTGSYDISGIIIEIDKNPDTFERKLNFLLSELQKDKNGILKLSEVAKTTIHVHIDFHNDNGMIGSPFLSKDHIKKLSELNLSIDFDLYVSGKQYIN
ncbi:DUF4279 domain-containing protein [Chryseobacterium sp. Mn2064]|uniref:DUF4279 domain-containing protein n=1 Tax=Chryseobacterium sp. Mn2064 TaxID=3395263 RepID=UPI003BBA8DAE